MNETALQLHLQTLHDELKEVKEQISELNRQLTEFNLGVSSKVVRLETQMKIVMGVIGAGGLGAAGFFGLGG